MQRPQGITAHAIDAPAKPDAGVALSKALKRLAALRATLHGDWSDGPASLLEVANPDLPDGDLLCWSPEAEPAAAAPTLTQDAPPVVAEAPAPLRGRFAEVADTVPATEPVDLSWLDLVTQEAPPESQSVLDEIMVALAFAEDREALIAQPALDVVAPEAEVVVIDDVVPAIVAAPTPAVLEDEEPVVAYGAIAGIEVLFVPITAPAAPVASAPVDFAVEETDPVTLGAFGAAPGLFALAVLDAPATAPQRAPATIVVADETDFDVPCAPLGMDVLFALAAPVAVEAPVAVAPAVSFEDDDTVEFAVGAFAIVFPVAPEVAPVLVATPVVAFEEPAQPDITFGAAPLLAEWLDAVPPQDVSAPVVRLFDPESLIDDALADAFDALICAPEPVDPYEAAWTPDAMAADVDHAAHLAACETHLWALPRHVPCAETFLLSPNHEIAVRITRALRVRANALEARAFAETAGFGFIKSDADAQAFWFLADALHDAASLSAGDADVDASFSDWRMNDDGLLVVSAPGNAHPKRPPPLISEAELDALFAHVDDAQSRVVLDDLGDDPTWNDTFWCDVDTYLEHVSETMDPAITDFEDDPAHDPFDIHDIEVRAAPIVEAAPITTFFWMPGDDYDLAVEGDGADLFIVSANESPAVVLIEDGSTFAMRTGQNARMDEVVVSLSVDAWRDIDAMHWRRVATLSGIAQVRVEQNMSCTRQVVLAGAFFATALEDEDVRLVLSADDGDVDYPVIRVGGLSLGDWGAGDTATDTAYL